MTTIKCRTCLLEVVEDTKFHYLNDNNLMLRSKLLGFLPELDLTITENPVACNKCSAMINEVHQFRHLCLQNEISLKNQNLLESSLNNILPLEENEYLLVNTDIPMCIEESVPKIVFFHCSYCQYATNDKQNLTDHISTHLFKCNQCSYTTHDNATLTSHKDVHSNIEPLQCNICNYTCIEKHILDEHMSTHTDGQLSTNKHLFECQDCSYQTTNETAFNHHLVTHMLQRKSSRTSKSITPYSIPAHNKKIKCSKCNYTTHKRQYLYNHTHRVHKKKANSKRKREVNINIEEKPIESDSVKLNLKNPKRKSEVIINTEEKPIESDSVKLNLKKGTKEYKLKQKQLLFQCKSCKYRTNVKVNFVRHQKMMHAKHKFKCDTCNYSTDGLCLIKIHMKKYSGEAPLKCNDCDFKSHVKTHFQSHIKIHKPKCKFKCDFCDYSTSQKGHFTDHVRTHTGEKPFACKFCNFRCSYRVTLKNHEGRHRLNMDENDFKGGNSNIETSIEAHYDEDLKTSCKEELKKCFACRECGYKTTSKGHFEEHLRVHTGEKPFNCKKCNYRTAFRANLKKHEKGH